MRCPHQRNTIYEFDAMNALFKHATCRRALPGSMFPFFCVKVQGIKALWRLQGMGPQQHCHWNSPVTNIYKNTGINHFRNILVCMCSDVFCHVWGNSMCAAKVLFVVHVVPQPSLWMQQNTHVWCCNITLHNKFLHVEPTLCTAKPRASHHASCRHAMTHYNRQ